MKFQLCRSCCTNQHNAFLLCLSVTSGYVRQIYLASNRLYVFLATTLVYTSNTYTYQIATSCILPNGSLNDKPTPTSIAVGGINGSLAGNETKAWCIHAQRMIRICQIPPQYALARQDHKQNAHEEGRSTLHQASERNKEMDVNRTHPLERNYRCHVTRPRMEPSREA